MMKLNREVRRHRKSWVYRGVARPPWAIEPTEGQESVWDYPRPPRQVRDSRLFEVYLAGKLLARTRGAVRVLETGSAPTIYFPPQDCASELIVNSKITTKCEWKGRAHPIRLPIDEQTLGWLYFETYEEFRQLERWPAFYPQHTECRIDGQLASAQPGGFYGGWITNEIVGPFKGEAIVSDSRET